MLNIYFDKLISNIKKLNVRKLLVFNVLTLTIDEIRVLDNLLDKLCLAVDNGFYINQVNGRFNSSEKIEAFNASSIKIYDYDAVYAYELNLPVLNIINSIQTINYIMLERTFSGDLSLIQTFCKIDDNVFKRMYNDAIVEDNEVENNIEEISLNNAERLKCSFAVVNYNTSKFINILIRSIKQFVKQIDYDIWIFDNSDKELLVLDENDSFVHIIDNTKAQIIDYNDAIKSYCDYKNKKAHDEFAEFISMKHCMALQKLIDDERLSDNIILCDSDIVLKKDLDFIDEKFAAIGSLEVKKEKVAKIRIVPFLCYVNRLKIKEFGLKYFDNHRCHGCLCSNGAWYPSYDTGAALYEDIQKKCKDLFLKIDINEYMYHFGGRSRTDRFRLNHYDQNINVDDIVKKLNIDSNVSKYEPPKINIKKYDFKETKNYDDIVKSFSIEDPKNEYVIYTAITGGYDKIHKQQFFQHDKFDYVCFTDTKITSDDNWKIIDISKIKEFIDLKDECRLARFIKTHPHLFFSNYKRSIWIDGNITIKNNRLEELIDFLGDNYLLMKKHPRINDVFGEIDTCKSIRKDDPGLLDLVKGFLKFEKFSDAGWHIESNVIVRNHNDSKCIELMEKWWEMIQKHSKRDQVSLNYIIKKYNGSVLIVNSNDMNKYLMTDYKHH